MPADPLRDAAQAPTDEIERIRARATAADYEPTAEDIELCQSGECGGCFVCYGRPILMFGESDVRLLLAEVDRLRAALAAADSAPAQVRLWIQEALAEEEGLSDFSHAEIIAGLRDVLAAADGTTPTTNPPSIGSQLVVDGTTPTPTQPDEVLWSGPYYELGDRLMLLDALPPGNDHHVTVEVRVVATPATE